MGNWQMSLKMTIRNSMKEFQLFSDTTGNRSMNLRFKKKGRVLAEGEG